MVEITSVKIKKAPEINVIIGQTHFIKTVEDLYEVLVSSVPNIQFGFAFCEASGACLVRAEGTDEELKKLAIENALQIGAGHTFILFLKNAYPINVLKALRDVMEIVNFFCATANPLEVIIVETDLGNAILGVVDGESPLGIESEKDIQDRKKFLRTIGYKIV